MLIGVNREWWGLRQSEEFLSVQRGQLLLSLADCSHIVIHVQCCPFPFVKRSNETQIFEVNLPKDNIGVFFLLLFSWFVYKNAV